MISHFLTNSLKSVRFTAGPGKMLAVLVAAFQVSINGSLSSVKLPWKEHLWKYCSCDMGMNSKRILYGWLVVLL